jgi:hypothetical protein
MSRHSTSIQRQNETRSASMRGRRPRRNSATSATLPAPGSPKFVGSGAPRYTVGTGEIGGDIAKRMCVAYCEIVESALDAGISANRKIGLIPINAECGAVDATDTKSFIARLANWKRQGQIVFARLRSTRTGVQNHVGRELIFKIISIHDVYPLRKMCSKWMTQCPHGLRREWIVVARNQEYRRMPGTTLWESPCKPFPRIRLGFWVIEQVPGA